MGRGRSEKDTTLALGGTSSPPCLSLCGSDNFVNTVSLSLIFGKVKIVIPHRVYVRIDWQVSSAYVTTEWDAHMAVIVKVIP